jgi:hypothetical protein
VRKPAAQLEGELKTTDDDDDENLILCRYSIAEPTGVSSTVGTSSESIARFMDRVALPGSTGISYWCT